MARRSCKRTCPLDGEAIGYRRQRRRPGDRRRLRRPARRRHRPARRVTARSSPDSSTSAAPTPTSSRGAWSTPTVRSSSRYSIDTLSQVVELVERERRRGRRRRHARSTCSTCRWATTTRRPRTSSKTRPCTTCSSGSASAASPSCARPATTPPRGGSTRPRSRRGTTRRGPARPRTEVPDHVCRGARTRTGRSRCSATPATGCAATRPVQPCCRTMPPFQGGLQPRARTTAAGLMRESIDPDDYRSRRVDQGMIGGFAIWSGTSFAAPIIAGKIAAAAARQAARGRRRPGRRGPARTGRCRGRA